MEEPAELVFALRVAADPDRVAAPILIYVPAGRSFTAFIDARDIGRVAATTFTEPGHTRKAYPLSGEQSLSYRTIARTMTEVLGRHITYARPSEKR